MTNYRKTLNLPKTEFSMKGNLVNQEPKILSVWKKEKVYEKIRFCKRNCKSFFLHDGPPYANGNIHIGHAINKILKDFILKSKGLMGYDAPYIPGWDCHGLPIELNVEKKFQKSKKTDVKEFLFYCRSYVTEQISNQKKDFIRLGVFGDWENPYLTMASNIEANIIRILGKIIQKKYLYQGIKPVHWCIKCKSSLAEAEVEYKDIESKSVFVTFQILNVDKLHRKFNLHFSFKKKVSVVVWTTTPWTLPFNRAIAINPNFNYYIVDIGEQCFILSDLLVKSTMSCMKIFHWKYIGKMQGRELEFVQCAHPFMEFSIPIVLSTHVTNDVGTGIVHISPGHGIEDFLVGKKYNLKNIVVDPDGKYPVGTLHRLDGKCIFSSFKIIKDLLQQSKNLLCIEKIKHSYPHCWRHGMPTIFRSASQWFIKMDKNKLRENLLKEIDKVNWIPENHINRMKVMIKNRPDWCISRQRIWGTPITLFVHKKNRTLHPNTINLIEVIAKLVEKYGIQIWRDIDPKKIIGDDALYYEKVLDTLDVWFDSGSTFSSVLQNRKEFFKYKSKMMYFEGSDQYRGWFMSSLIISFILNQCAPYDQVITHGFTVDKCGKKMSKSKGNVITPNEIINRFGADILRIWIASTNYVEDVIFSEENIKNSVNVYRRIRNIARFLLGNLYDFVPEIHIVHAENMILIDRWIIGKTKKVQEKIISFYKNYNFCGVVQEISKFCFVELSTIYLEIVKDRQYTHKVGSISRRSCQTAFYHILESLVRWIAPIIPFTADQIWKYIPGNRSKFVFTELWYEKLFDYNCIYPWDENFWSIIFSVKKEINKIYEKNKLKNRVKNLLEVCVFLYATSDIKKKLCSLGDELRFVFLTSEVKIFSFEERNENAISCENLQGLRIYLFPLKGRKCERCWQIREDIGACIKYAEICGRCISNTVGLGEKRRFV